MLKILDAKKDNAVNVGVNMFGAAVRRREDGEVAKIQQSGPDYIRVGQMTSEWARLHQSGPNDIRVCQITSEWAKLHQSGPNYCAGYNVAQGTIIYNTTT